MSGRHSITVRQYHRMRWTYPTTSWLTPSVCTGLWLYITCRYTSQSTCEYTCKYTCDLYCCYSFRVISSLTASVCTGASIYLSLTIAVNILLSISVTVAFVIVIVIVTSMASVLLILLVWAKGRALQPLKVLALCERAVVFLMWYMYAHVWHSCSAYMNIEHVSSMITQTNIPGTGWCTKSVQHDWFGRTSLQWSKLSVSKSVGLCDLC